MVKLNKKQKKALSSIKNGADIYCYSTALTLRGMQKKHGDKYFEITKAMAYDGDGSDQMPYFGAILNGEGLKAINA